MEIAYPSEYWHYWLPPVSRRSLNIHCDMDNLDNTLIFALVPPLIGQNDFYFCRCYFLFILYCDVLMLGTSLCVQKHMEKLTTTPNKKTLYT